MLLSFTIQAQTATLRGKVIAENKSVEFANVFLKGTQIGSITDSVGNFLIKNIPIGTHKIVVTAIGYDKIEKTITLKENAVLNVELFANRTALDEVVVSGTMKEVSKLESPVPVEVYTAKFFKTNPTPSIFDALQNVNGVRPQINCNVCNTGDIHINGLEGPYTMVLIDGMPIVSGLSTVYGLSGIPQSLIERVEIVKGPASTLYGSEAVGGLINIITKKPTNAPIFSADIFGTTWGEINTDFAAKFNTGKKAQSLIGVNYFNFQNRVDNNYDGFTDMTLQNRISVFNKWNFERKNNRIFSLAVRYVYEDRWGGDMNWSKKFRGGDSIYGESIYTNRWEFFGTYQLPVKEKILFHFSTNGHNQNSVYGNMPYMAEQYIGFGQLTWNKQLKSNDFLIGATFRYTYYDDNTPATASFDTIGIVKNMPSNTYLPGIFIQNEISINENNKLLLGIRYDYNSIHGNIITPRLNYKWSSTNKNNVLRLSFGNGYRVANVFTEDHAALTGARKVTFLSDLKPETSWNGNINFVKKIYAKNGTFIGLDATAFYTYFTNKIIADYNTDPNKIMYNNLDGYAISKGISLNLDIAFNNGLKFLIGGTCMDVYSVENNIKIRQMFTENFTGVWNVGYTFKSIGLTIDYTGNVYSSMRLPLLSNLDPRKEYSPWWSIQNIQLTKKIKKRFELYGGVKNLLNWTPNKGNPFIIARTNDPFDKEVQFDTNGQAIATPNNPYGLTFDPAYVYGPNQGARGFVGFRYIF
ncbi:MAG: TonB-dependent receptor [Chitinophagaceae bacterium]|nr:TonB-dependent receptor [Chitinophagaceae bacterium]MCW5903989.1 TonB-dependent receptor [Chitinophagaceae bacterium]